MVMVQIKTQKSNSTAITKSLQSQILQVRGHSDCPQHAILIPRLWRSRVYRNCRKWKNPKPEEQLLGQITITIGVYVNQPKSRSELIYFYCSL